MLCNRLHEVEQRLARWLLTLADRVESEQVQVTQEYIAEMLGARRSTVTVAAGALQERGLISYSRGKVSILDRPAHHRDRLRVLLRSSPLRIVAPGAPDRASPIDGLDLARRPQIMRMQHAEHRARGRAILRHHQRRNPVPLHHFQRIRRQRLGRNRAR